MLTAHYCKSRKWCVTSSDDVPVIKTILSWSSDLIFPDQLFREISFASFLFFVEMELHVTVYYRSIISKSILYV